MDMVNIEIDGRKLQASSGETILQVAKRAGVYIPTLCYHPAVSLLSSCRICIVEVGDCERLVASCSYPVFEGMQVKTHSKRILNARRTVLELILANHPMDCLKCVRNGSCELQTLAEEFNITDIRYQGKKRHYEEDTSSKALVRDPEKCILCGRCIKACGEIQSVWTYDFIKRGFNMKLATAFDCNMDESVCIDCGQCIIVCPTAALKEKSAISDVFEGVFDKSKVSVVQTAPSIRVTIAEALGLDAGLISTGKMVSALRKIGFDYVFDTSFSADLTIMEEAKELLHRVQNNGVLPMFTSCSPGWVKFVETFYPKLIPNLSTCKSPQQMLGAVIKSHFAQQANIDPQKIYSVAVMPCTAKKFERDRDVMSNDVDVVITTRELAKMIKMAGIEFDKLEDSEFDNPLGSSTGAAELFASAGGVLEAALRTAHYMVTGKPAENIEFSFARGLEGVKESVVRLGDAKIKVAAVNTLGNARMLINKILCEEVHYDFIEVMACPGGCIGGGGQPRGGDKERLLKRMKAVYEIDKNKQIRESHENLDIQKLYKEFLKEPGSEISHKYLHTKYQKREGL